MGTVVSTDDSGPIQTVKVRYDDETMRRLIEDAKDKLAGYVGAILIVIGTIICGYGDFAGRIF